MTITHRAGAAGVVMVLAALAPTTHSAIRLLTPQQASPAPANSPATDSAATADRLLAKAAAPADAALAWFEEQAQQKPTSYVNQGPPEARLGAAVAEAMGRAAELQGPALRLFDADAKSWTTLAPGQPPRLPARVVLLVGGLDEPAKIFDTAAAALTAALAKATPSVRVARFDAPLDQPLRASGDALGACLRDLSARGVQRVDLVGHSSGGLVVRDVLTRPALYNGRPTPPPTDGLASFPTIGRVVLVGTPNRGAWLAPLRAGREARAQLARWIDADGRDPAALLAVLSFGSGEAARDLVPGSAYLSELNARPTPKWSKGTGTPPTPAPASDEIPVTVVVGTLSGGAALEGVDLKPMLAWPIVRQCFAAADLDKAGEAIDELARVVSDGLVPVSSAELEGAEDVVYAEANHRSLLRPWVQGESELPPGVRALVERLGN